MVPENRVNIDALLEKGLLPDWLIRFGIRRLLAQRLKDEDKGNTEAQAAALMQYIEELKKSPIAVQTQAANEQHYEVPAEFYRLALGKHLKYSSGYWDRNIRTQDQSEEAMLDLTCARAELKTAETILELGCGWGSLSLYMAERFRTAKITAVSNSRTQREYIESQIVQRGLKNLKIITADMNEFHPQGLFDRVVSVEMFEHMRNYEQLMERIASWLLPGGKLFVHIFTHKKFAYLFEPKDASDWMSRNFFTGGQMPSDSLLLYFQKNLGIRSHWNVSGTHYSKTSEGWLANMDRAKTPILEIFSRVYGPDQAHRRWHQWRVFFMACAELWGYRNGEEWIVSHYLFEKS